MRLQGSQTRLVGLGGDISRVKRESAGDGRKREGSREGKARGSSGTVAGKGSDSNNACRMYVRACVLRACACERAALDSRARWRGGEKRQALERERRKL
jgi:hypothetical protein